MNKVGIGQLKYAKQQQKTVPVQGTRIKYNARKHKKAIKKNDKNAKKEGQLAVDILQTEDKMIIICPIAGVENSDIKVAIQDDVLTIRGERKGITGLDNKQALVRELFWGTFSRSIVLPDHIDRKNISARSHEHMLIITIPKTEDFKTRIIHINDESQ